MKKSISIKDLKKLKEKEDKILFIDVRSPAEYRSKHLKGSYNIPLDEIQKVISDFNNINGTIIFLCKTGMRSSKACITVSSINKNNDEKFLSLEGGVEDLEKAGFEIITGRNTWDLERQVRFVAGTLVAIGIILGHFMSSYFYLLSLFVGLGLVFASVTNTCAMGMILMKMPWNKGSKNIHVKTTMHDIIKNN